MTVGVNVVSETLQNTANATIATTRTGRRRLFNKGRRGGETELKNSWKTLSRVTPIREQMSGYGGLKRVMTVGVHVVSETLKNTANSVAAPTRTRRRRSMQHHRLKFGPQFPLTQLLHRRRLANTVSRTIRRTIRQQRRTTRTSWISYLGPSCSQFEKASKWLRSPRRRSKNIPHNPTLLRLANGSRAGNRCGPMARPGL